MTSQDSTPSPETANQDIDVSIDVDTGTAEKTIKKTVQRHQKPLFIGLGIGAIGLVAIAGIAAVLLNPSDGPSNPTAPAQPSAVAPEGETAPAPSAAEADAEAEARAAWDAQQQKISAVLGTMDRATLVGESPTKGNPDASVILIKFSDFQCPYCAVASSDMKTFMDGHESDVLYVYKHFPLDAIHPEATPAAKAAWAAGQQGQFWLFHNGLFAYQDRLGDDLYVELAEKIQLDLEQFNRDRNSEEAAAAVTQDSDLAIELGLRGTPSFLMNDIMIPAGAPLELFEELTTRIQAAQEQE